MILASQPGTGSSPKSTLVSAGNYAGVYGNAYNGRPTVPFASTNYGFDPGAGNNYGLGPTFASTTALQVQSNAQSAAPSWWWLIPILLGVWLFAR